MKWFTSDSDIWKELQRLHISCDDNKRSIKLIFERLRYLEENETSDTTAIDDSCDCAFDFRSMNVFGIERKDGETIISYFYKEGDTAELNFHCNKENHNKLVQQYEEHLKRKYADNAVVPEEPVYPSL
jgi:hypothetical protein